MHARKYKLYILKNSVIKFFAADIVARTPVRSFLAV